LKQKIIKRAEAEICLVRSKNTKKLYYALLANGNPIKYWAFDDMSPAANDFIGELINAFDMGYDIRCQFPVEKDGKKVLVPRNVEMFNEPGVINKNKHIEEDFFDNKDLVKIDICNPDF